jgi:hypothetical protein
MNIGLDFHDTYTKDPIFWDQVIFLAQRYDHEVYVVTAAAEGEDEDVYDVPVPLEQIFFTARNAKHQFMKAEGIKIDVWIDNEPEFIKEDKE